ncbi:hypothetical protein COLO4_25823 [Corchorus olitorius]|uniref:LURP1-like domain-containing protein n=1 Tax=Corchorus olitorius TaxID=93759 RepID=A0A1R3HZU5_9ROSI|nr:hypothetical protein COLO4_25823 [Corchorus olitorius]
MATSEMAYGVPMVSVVAGGLCVPYPVELIVKKKHHGFFDVNYQVLDVKGNLFLQVDGSYMSLYRKRIMRDPAGFPILTMREKAITGQKWAVHRGESSDRGDLIFIVQRSHCNHMKTRLQVLLPSNITQDICNFQVVTSYPFKSATVYKGDNAIAEVNYNLLWKSFCKGTKEDFRVKVYPGVDYAFIVALLIILVESNIMFCAA